MAEQKKLLTGMRLTPNADNTIEVYVKPSVMLDDYARQLVVSAQFHNPQRFEVKPLDPDQMVQYCRFIVYQRIQQVKGEKIQWYKLKDINVPEFLSQVLPSFGRVDYFEYGRLYMPNMHESFNPTIDIDQALTISGDLEFYKGTLRMHKDAFPRVKDGDFETMNCACDSAGMVLTTISVKSDIAVAHAAFLGFTQPKDSWFLNHLELRADRIDVIKRILLNSEEVRGIVESGRTDR